jgi:NAD(P)-dependent dehydrogenase (short-subunit alcohol dehydrogenase family)
MNLEILTKQYDFTGRTVVITGGTGILGGEIACALCGCGAEIAILDVHLEPGEAIKERVGAGASRIALFPGDVMNPESLRKTADDVIARFGKVDCLINAAGGNKPQATTNQDLKFFDLPTDALRWVFDLNILGTIIPCQTFGRIMAECGEGNILNISSMNAYRPLTRIPAYSAAKAGVNNFTQWLAVHMAQEYARSIRVNAIAPGFFLTNQNRFLLHDRETGGLTARGKSIIAHTPMGRFGEADELLGAVLGLLSPASSFVTGAIIPIDGGFSAFSGV